eukprot:jgi/Chrzof1/7457/Cz02g24210.t1
MWNSFNLRARYVACVMPDQSLVALLEAHPWHARVAQSVERKAFTNLVAVGSSPTSGGDAKGTAPCLQHGNRNQMEVTIRWRHSVVVITLDFESRNPSSNLGGA